MYALITNGQVEKFPYSIGLLRKDHPNTSFPKTPTEQTLASFGVYPVREINPTVGESQKLQKTWTPEYIGGEWLLNHQAVDMTVEEIAERDAVVRNDLHAAIDAERDRRLAADFTFNGKQFQRDATSLARIAGAATLAGLAVVHGSPAGNLRWANPARDFEWIASDDTRVQMDAQTAFDFGAAAAQVETTLVFAASALRAMSPIPADFTDDKWWT